MVDFMDGFSAPAQLAIAKAAELLTGAVLKVAAGAGAKSVFSRLTGGERRDVTRAFERAIATTLRDFPELNEIGFAEWLEQPPPREAFLEILSKPILDPDPSALARLLEPSQFDPSTFPVELPLLVATLRDHFLTSLYSNPKTRSLFDAVVQQDQLAAQRLILDYQRRAQSTLESIQAAISEIRETPIPRVPFMAPDLPPSFVPRPAVFEEIRSKLLRAKGGSVAITTALQGAGGFGKTTLAVALCHDPAVQKEFADGILWVELGETPDLPLKLAELYSALTGKRPGFVGESDATTAIAAVLEERRCILVVDDVWKLEHLRPFLRGGLRCVRLVTTRHLHVAGSAALVRVDEMTGPEAVRLLASKLPDLDADRKALRHLAGRLGEWPLMLDLAGSTLRNRIRQGDTMDGAFAFIQAQLDSRGPTAFDLRNTDDRALAVALTVDLSLHQLDAQERQMLLELSIFPEDVPVPLSVVTLLWGSTRDEMDAFLFRLHDLALVRYEPRTGTMRLHDVMRRYFADRLMEAKDPAVVHARLLDRWSLPAGPVAVAARPTANVRSVAWWRLPPGEAYAWQHLAWHLVAAGRVDELRDLLFDCRWLEAKLRMSGLLAVLADFEVPTHDEELSLVARALRRSGHVVSGDPGQLRSQLTGRLVAIERPRIQQLLADAVTTAVRPWLRPVRPSLTPPTGPLLRTMAGHVSEVSAIALTSDGQRAVSASWDRTLVVWDVESGAAERRLKGHKSGVMAVAMTADGRHAISGDHEGTLRVWDLETGREVWTLKGPASGVTAVAVSADGRRAISGHDGGILNVWNLETGVREVPELAAHQYGVTAVAITADGRRALSGSHDQTLKVWELDAGPEERLLSGHDRWVEELAVTPDGRLAVSGADDGSLKVWDLGTLTPLRTLGGYRFMVDALAVSPDGRRAVAGFYDGTLQVWDLESGVEERVLTAHAGGVKSVALAADGRRAVSSSYDGTVNVWDLDVPSGEPDAARHALRVSAVAITADGRRAVSGSMDQTVKVWNGETGSEEQTLLGNAGVTALALPEGTLQVVAGTWNFTVQAWGLGKEAEESSPARRRVVVAGGRSRGIEPNNVWIVKVWTFEADPGQASVVAENQRAMPMALTAGGWGAGETGGSIAWDAWNLETDMQVRVGLGVPVVALAANGRRAAAGFYDGTLQVWNLETGTLERTLTGPTWITAVAFSADSRYAIAGFYDGTLKVWDLERGARARTVKGHSGKVNGVALTPDARRAASVSWDRTLRLWDLKRGRLLAAFTADGSLECCAVTPEGMRLITGDKSGSVHLLVLEGLPSS